MIAPLTAKRSGRLAPEVDTETGDSALVRRAREGERTAFEQLYRRHAGRAYAFCLRLTGNPTEAEEMTQELFVRAWQNIEKLESGSHFRAWLHRVATNLWLTQLRRKKRWGDPLDLEQSEAARANQRPVRLLRVALDRAVSTLPHGARTVLVLHDIYGYRHREIAELLGVHEGTSKVHLHRARKKLREVLSP